MHSFISDFRDHSRYSLLRACVFAGLLIVITGLLARLWMTYINQMIYIRLKSIEKKEYKHAEAISVGASHGVDIDFSSLGMDDVPMWFPGADLFETEELLKQVYHSGGKPQWVFMVLNPYTLFQDNGLLYEPLKLSAVNSFSRDYAYHGIGRLSFCVIIDHDLLGWLRATFIPARDEGHQFFNMARLLRDCWQDANRKKTRFSFIQFKNPASQGLVEYQVALQHSFYAKTLSRDSDIVSRTLKALEKIEQLTVLNHSRLVVIAGVPEIKSYHNALSERDKIDELTRDLDTKAVLDQAIKRLDAPSTQVVLLDDIWNHESDGERLEWFSDTHHLNAKGSREFTRRLKPLLDLKGH